MTGVARVMQMAVGAVFRTDRRPRGDRNRSVSNRIGLAAVGALAVLVLAPIPN